MSKPASRVIGIIRLSEPPRLGLDLSVALDDSTPTSLLAGLVGKQPAVAAGRQRWQPLPARPRASTRRSLRANLSRLREDLQREYYELAAR
jgi:hypothetical protein